MREIMNYILNSIPYMLCAIPIIVLIRVLYNLGKKKIPTNWFHEIGVLLLFMFAVGVASQTMIPKLNFGISSVSIIKWSNLTQVNLIPGKVFIDIYKECFVNHYPMYFVINIIGSICLFLPIGFGIPLLWKNVSAKRVIIIALLFSLLIELCQFPQARGTDIDDIWISVLGVIMGYIVYSTFAKTRVVSFFNKFKDI